MPSLSRTPSGPSSDASEFYANEEAGNSSSSDTPVFSDDDDELFTPKNKKQRLNDAKPDALIEFEKQQKKRSGAELKSDAKRATYGSGMDVGFL